MSLQEQIEASVTDSLVQLGRGSGISPEARERMAKIISAPVVFIAEDHAEAIREETKERYSALETAVREFFDELDALRIYVHPGQSTGSLKITEGRLRALLEPDSTEVK